MMGVGKEHRWETAIWTEGHYSGGFNGEGVKSTGEVDSNDCAFHSEVNYGRSFCFPSTHHGAQHIVVTP